MLNKNRLIQLSILLLILLALVTWKTVVSISDKTAKQVADVREESSSLVRCDYLTPCEFVTRQGVFWLSVKNPPIKAEQWVNLSLQSKIDTWKVLNAKIVGKAMFMGRIPVKFIAANKHEFTAKTIFGACTTDEMIWQLQVTIEINGEQQVLDFDFLVEK